MTSELEQPVADQAPLIERVTDYDRAHLVTYLRLLDAARRRDHGEDIATEAACCKLFTSEMVGRVADRAVQIHGGNGYMTEYGIERFFRDVRLMRIYEGTSQIQQIVIARNMIREAEAL